MPKAILITEENVRGLEHDYDYEDEELNDVIGYYLLSDFGESLAILGFLSEEHFKQHWIRHSDLENGYFHAVQKNFNTVGGSYE